MKKTTFLLTVILTAIISCQKAKNDNIQTAIKTQKSITVEEAKNWYSAMLIGKARTDSSASIINNRSKFNVQWDISVTNEDEFYSIVEFPVDFEKSKGYNKRDSINGSQKIINSFIKLLVLKDKKSGYIHAILMNLHSYSNQNISSSIYKKPVKNFSGLIFYTDLELRLINGWEYKNGKTIAEFKYKKNSTGLRLAVPEDECTTYFVDTYERICVENYCSEWTLVNSTQVTSCPNSGSGGYTPFSCSSGLTAEEILDRGGVVSETISSTVGDYKTDPVTKIESRTQFEKWRFYIGDAIWGTFDCISWDQGLQVKKGASWEWVNVIHKAHGIVNNASMIEPAITQMITSSYVTTDKKTARMNLDFIVQVRFVCLGVVTSPADRNLFSSKAFSVN